MKEIVSSVEGVSGIMTEISHASDEQSRGIDQISKAMSELDTTTQQNAALVQESSAAAGSLEQQSGQLSRLISLFKLGHEGESKAHRTRTVAAQPVAQTAAPVGEGTGRRSESGPFDGASGGLRRILMLRRDREDLFPQWR